MGYKYSLNGKIEARTPLIRSGSNVWKGIGQEYVIMFTHEKINEILGVSSSLASDITIYAVNGDDAALALADISVVYISFPPKYIFIYLYSRVIILFQKLFFYILLI